MIWEYYASSSDVDATHSGVRSHFCPFCSSALHTIHRDRDLQDNGTSKRLFRVQACPLCGWWVSKVTLLTFYRGAVLRETMGAIATLREFDTGGLDEPLEAVRTYLLAKYSERFVVHPRVFEGVVASVFGSLGFEVRATAYSRDGGVDVVLDGSGPSPVAIQVKRSRKAIKVDLIREFTGALVQGGYTRGVFVTTSNFTRGAAAAADVYRLRGYPMELINADRFYEALKLTQRPMYDTVMGNEPFLIAMHHELYSRARAFGGGAA